MSLLDIQDPIDGLLRLLVKGPGRVLARWVLQVRDAGAAGRGYALEPSDRASWTAGVLLWAVLALSAWLVLSVVSR